MTRPDRRRPVRAAIHRSLVWLAALLVSATAAQGTSQVPVMVLQTQAVGTGFELDGVAQPVKQSTVSAQAIGRIATLTVKAGDRVRSGQLLATIDDREAQAGVQRSQAQVAQADAELRNARAHLGRTRELQTQGYVSAAALDSADAQFKGAQAGRDQAGAGERQSALAQGFTRVSAPFDGWVLQTHAEAGDLAVAGKPLLTLYAPLPIRAVVQVPVSRSALARASEVIEVLLQDSAGATHWVRPVTRSIVPTADPVSQTIEWRLELPPEAAKSLLPGQHLRVRFSAGQTDRTLVPAAAILRRGELSAVYVVSGKGFALRAVRLGAEHAQGIEVLSGLAAGERIAVDPVKAGLAGAQPAAPQ
ncbi:MAG: efflux RND transporter periplasmic adaptor subunit [Burkholderiaceae bacterium]